MYTHTYYIYIYTRMSSNNFYTNSSITLMYSLPYIYKHSRESHFPLVKRAFPNVIIKCNLSTASRREQRGGGGGGGAFDRFEAKIRSWHENLDPTLRKTLLSSRFRPRWKLFSRYFSSKHNASSKKESFYSNDRYITRNRVEITNVANERKIYRETVSHRANTAMPNKRLSRVLAFLKTGNNKRLTGRDNNIIRVE